MPEIPLEDIYLGYIACLNRRDWPCLEHFVIADLQYNGKRIGASGLQTMLKQYCADVPDLHFEVHMLVSQPPIVASRLVSNCTPGSTFLGLPVHRKRISFSENAFYRFQGEKIQQIWSVIDKAAIEAQL